MGEGEGTLLFSIYSSQRSAVMAMNSKVSFKWPPSVRVPCVGRHKSFYVFDNLIKAHTLNVVAVLVTQ